MDLTTLLGIGSGLVTAAAAIAAGLPPPPAASTGVYSILYTVLNFVAMNFGHAKNANAPTPPGA